MQGPEGICHVCPNAIQGVSAAAFNTAPDYAVVIGPIQAGVQGGSWWLHGVVLFPWQLGRKASESNGGASLALPPPLATEAEMQCSGSFVGSS